MTRPGLALCLAFAALAPLSAVVAPSAYATPDDDRARAAFDEGRAHYDAARFAEAALAFHEAWQLSQRHGLLLNVGLAQVQAGDLDGATHSLARYRALASPDVQLRASAALSELEQRLSDAGVDPSAAPAIRVTAIADGDTPEARDEPALAEEVGAAPAPSPEPAPSPQPEDAPQPEHAAALESSPLLALDDPGDDPLPTLIIAPALPARGPPRWGLVATGVTTLATGSIAAGVTYSVSREWLETGDRASYVALRPVNHGAIALAGVGAGLTALGMTMRHPRAPRALSVSPWVAPASAGVAVTASLKPGW